MTNKWQCTQLDVESDVRAFFDKFGVPTRVTPGWPDDKMVDFRMRHIAEEHNELVSAIQTRNLEEVADALIDLVYLAVGTCLAFGIPFSAVWREVQEANMKKVRAASDGSNSKRSSSYDVVKPEGWQPPNVAGVLETASREALR